MTNYIQSGRLKHVDQTLATMRAAGYDLGDTDIAFIWRVGAGQADAEEIEKWTLQMAVKLANRTPDPVEVLTDFQAVATNLRLQIGRAARIFNDQFS